MNASWRRGGGFALRTLLTALVLGYLFGRADVTQVVAALRRIPAASVAAALLALSATVGAGVVRWRALLFAYGATERPRCCDLARWYLIAGLYNLLPGAVGGDVARGYGTRTLFADQAVRSLAVVFVERVLGFAGVVVLAAVASAFSPFAHTQVFLYAALGLLAATAAIFAVAQARLLSRWLPAGIGRRLAELPSIQVPAQFALGALLSVVSQLCASATGHFLVASLSSRVTWADSLVIFPLATLASFFPLTVAGAGARDTALVILLARIGVGSADALACSLALLA